MKTTYPIIIHPQGKEGYHFVEIPDLDGCTQGKNLNECLEMAADYINLCILDYEDRNKPAPKPSPIANIHIDEGNIVTLVHPLQARNSSKRVKKALTTPTA